MSGIKPLYLDLKTVAGMLSISHVSVQKMVRDGKFPKPRVISERRVGWLVREVEEWAEARPISDLLPPANTGWRKGITGSLRAPQADPTNG